MSEFDLSDDPSLTAFEQSLSQLALSPNAQRRDELLYAAGLAAGRARAFRQVRVTSAALLLIAGGIGGSLYRLGLSMSPAPPEAPMVAESHPDERQGSTWVTPDDHSREPERPDVLRVGSRYDALASLDWERSLPEDVRRHEMPPPVPNYPAVQPRLTVSSHAWTELLLD